jgi:hypothetical protein
MTQTAGPWPLFDNSGLTLKRRVTVTIGDNRLDVTALEREDQIVIAAAPDMLAALESVQRWGRGYGTATHRDMMAWVDSAIAKAKAVQS